MLEDNIFDKFHERFLEQVSDKNNWGEGEWQFEPDEFIFKYKGFTCAGRRETSVGVWNGYVYISVHSKYNNEIERNKLNTYGKLLYAYNINNLDENELNEYDDVSTIGFVCAIPFLDFAPVVNAMKKIFMGIQNNTDEIAINQNLTYIKFKLNDGSIATADMFMHGSYKNVAFVVKELKALVDQLV